MGPEHRVAEDSSSSRSTRSPLLLLTDDTAPNPFGGFLAEILSAEGLQCFDRAPTSSVGAGTLDGHDTVVLADVNVDAGLAEELERFVYRGGGLVCMRPRPRLARLLGVERLAHEQSDGYLVASPDHPAASGICPEHLQYHGVADAYRLAGARAVAWLSSAIGTRSEYPAVTLNQFGSGWAAMWAFDLALSVALTRQGNPAWSNLERDGMDGVRTADLFKGWIDLDRIAIPQADELQRLFANLLSSLAAGKRPLPRLWYFPGDAQGMLVATGDSHMNPAPFIEEVLSAVEQRGGHISIYYSPQLASDWGRASRRARFFVSDHLPIIGDALTRRFGSPTPRMVDEWRARGHEFTVHPWVESGLQDGWCRYWREFTGRGYGPITSTVRTHRILWSGWVETARTQEACGIGMNLDYYHVGPWLHTDDGEWVFGHLTGSGLPMRFVDERGEILDIFQQTTQLADEHLMAMDVPGWGGWPDLSPRQAVEVSRTVLSRAIEPGGHSAIGAQFHVDPFQVGGEPAAKAGAWLVGTLDVAVELGIPIWSAEEWVRFTRSRSAAGFAEVEWRPADGRVSFRVRREDPGPGDLTVLVPMAHDGRHLKALELDGTAARFGRQVVGSIAYASTTVERSGVVVTAVYA